MRGLCGLVHGAVEWPGTHGVRGVQAWEQIATGQDLPRRMGMAPPDPQPFQQDRRQQRVAILVTLALLDTQEHALAVNITDLQRGHLADAQSGTIGHRERSAMLEGLGRLDKARYLLAT